MKEQYRYSAIVIGTSAGGLHALSALLEELPRDYRMPVIIVQHRIKDDRGELLEEVLQQKCSIIVKQANEKESILNGRVYFAPPDYHLLVDNDLTFSLTTDEKVNYARPSIDVLFETAAEAYKDKLAGIILTGANSDGRRGIEIIKSYRGLTIAQDPQEADYPEMPKSAIASGAVDKILSLTDIKKFLLRQATL
jgi:two-component system chemotaxis response regulator CheB